MSSQKTPKEIVSPELELDSRGWYMSHKQSWDSTGRPVPWSTAFIQESIIAALFEPETLGRRIRLHVVREPNEYTATVWVGCINGDQRGPWREIAFRRPDWVRSFRFEPDDSSSMWLVAVGFWSQVREAFNLPNVGSEVHFWVEVLD